MQILNGQKIRDELLSKLKERVAALPFVPLFCDVVIGGDPASLQYVRMKEKAAGNIGIRTLAKRFPSDISTQDLILEIQKITKEPNLCGLIVQMPLPLSINTKAVLDTIPESVDVDVLSSSASARFYEGDPIFVFPTAAAVLALIDSAGVELSEKNVVVVGRGMLVGGPVTHLLKNSGISVTILDERTPGREEILKSADVLISAVGKPGLIKGEDLKEGVVVIDAGTAEKDGGIKGDVDRDSVESVAGVLSPVPGGVGPVTVAMLMQNVVVSAERKTHA